MEWTITLLGPPIPQPRPRVSAIKGRKGSKGPKARAYVPKKHKVHSYRNSIAALAMMEIGGKTVLNQPVAVDIIFVAARPGNVSVKHFGRDLIWKWTRPDVDNLVKAVLDGLGTIMVDDALVVELHALKLYAEKGGEPRTVVRIRELTGQTPSMAMAKLGMMGV